MCGLGTRPLPPTPPRGLGGEGVKMWIGVNKLYDFYISHGNVLGYFYFFVSIGDDVLVSVSSYLSILPVVVYSMQNLKKKRQLKKIKTIVYF
jgi:hypothetical protein